MPRFFTIPSPKTFEGYVDTSTWIPVTLDVRKVTFDDMSGYWGSFELNPADHTAEITIKTYKNFNLRTGIPND